MVLWAVFQQPLSVVQIFRRNRPSCGETISQFTTTAAITAGTTTTGESQLRVSTGARATALGRWDVYSLVCNGLPRLMVVIKPITISEELVHAGRSIIAYFLRHLVLIVKA